MVVQRTATGDQPMAEGSRTRKPGQVSLHPLKFEDALHGLLKTRPGEKPEKKETERDSHEAPASESAGGSE
jgi:hypothetical protein